MTARNYPWLVRHCLDRGCELIAHGISASRMITSRMTRGGGAGVHRRVDRGLARRDRPRAARLGRAPSTANRRARRNSSRDAGIRYVCDWANDEQPYRMKTAAGELYALPVMVELDDAFALRDRRFRVDEYCQQLKDAFDMLYEDAAASGRLLALNLHPWSMGQAFRVEFLEEALAHMMRRGGVWPATGGEIVDWFSRSAAAGG